MPLRRRQQSLFAVPQAPTFLGVREKSAPATRRRLAEMPDKSFNPDQSATPPAHTRDFLRR
jgi:hypothetical protein